MKINKIEKDVPIPIVKSKFDYPWEKWKLENRFLLNQMKGNPFSNSSALLDPQRSILGT